ncbi:universal stress protein [Haloplanus aerogenes]|uniref:Nucleotide-binding universal stress UspA family protein n=1 Tax=Haloplanus aerogenes TaxID=660522 RepID=A0A3M0DTL2_9EURY|nr:universal stress protein [Haloplanus aerogenes]AZH24326.1 universal stress protein [Haloplanus aerogenes]RMB24040.1 nucleotide-binding universal stress UspA family protein [Haloplanus aerogenes]
MKLLLGIGGSDDSMRALERAVDRAAETGDDLTVAILRNPATDTEPADIERRAQAILDDAGVEAAIRHLEGDPGSELVELAEREGFDRIILGGGETSPMGKIKLGSISEFVLLNSHVSVTLVR